MSIPSVSHALNTGHPALGIVAESSRARDVGFFMGLGLQSVIIPAQVLQGGLKNFPPNSWRRLDVWAAWVYAHERLRRGVSGMCRQSHLNGQGGVVQ